MIAMRPTRTQQFQLYSRVVASVTGRLYRSETWRGKPHALASEAHEAGLLAVHRANGRKR